MITTAEILSIAYDGNDCRVRIPLFEAASSIIRTSIPAKFTSVPGIYNNYKVGDYVWVAFDRELFGYPVVIGKIYNGGTKERNENRGTANFDALKVSGSVSLPKDTTITLSNGMTVSLNSFFTDNTGVGWNYNKNITIEGSTKSYEVIISIHNIESNKSYKVILNTHNEYTSDANGCHNFLKRLRDAFDDKDMLYPIASCIGSFTNSPVGAYAKRNAGVLDTYYDYRTGTERQKYTASAANILGLVTQDGTEILVIMPTDFSASKNLISEIAQEVDTKYVITDFKCIETTDI